jgi:hypothetical protein
MPLDPQQLQQAQDDTYIHWLLGGISSLGTLCAGVIAWNGRDAMARLKAVEEGKADKDDIQARFDEMAENQRQMMKRSDDMHTENRATLNSIWSLLANQSKK